MISFSGRIVFYAVHRLILFETLTYHSHNRSQLQKGHIIQTQIESKSPRIELILFAIHTNLNTHLHINFIGTHTCCMMAEQLTKL